jgi:hypothetical protein
MEGQHVTHRNSRGRLNEAVGFESKQNWTGELVKCKMVRG